MRENDIQSFVLVGVLLLFNVVYVESFFGAVSKQPTVVPSKIDRTKNPQWLDSLKYDGQPNFDVLQKTMEFASARDYESAQSFYDDEYIFRGSVIGPITGEEVKRTQKGFNIVSAYPDLETRPFGFTIDPDNPFRCYYMERWEGTNTGALQIGSLNLPPTNNEVQLPTHVMSVNWTPEGKIIYVCLSSPLDRFEGTTKGAGAVFGLLTAGGLENGNVSVGNTVFRLQQRLAHLIGGLGRNWSEDEEIPAWWKSKARGADPNDM